MQYESVNREQIIQLLKDQNILDFDHSEKTLLDHLEQTERILFEWNQSESLCLAGLLHSVFGTEVFTNVLIPDSRRSEINEIVGSEAGDLIFYFGVMERKHFLAQIVENSNEFSIKHRQKDEIYSINKNTFVELCHLYLANRLEQHPRWPDEYRFHELEEMKAIRNFVNAKAVADLNKEYQL